MPYYQLLLFLRLVLFTFRYDAHPNGERNVPETIVEETPPAPDEGDQAAADGDASNQGQPAERERTTTEATNVSESAKMSEFEIPLTSFISCRCFKCSISVVKLTIAVA